MSDRVAVFHAGDIAQIAPPGDIYEKPADAYVAGFVGENNLLSGSIEASPGGLTAVRLSSGAVVSVACSWSGSGPVTLAVRPEKMRLNQDAEGLANRISARVTELAYLGDQLRMLVDLGGSQIAMVKIAAFDKNRPQVGDTVDIGWNPEDGHLFASA
jgi:putative spermidine/putrescine transport system ATP-binding protein